MSFGYSVSDFIAIIKLADQVRKRFIRAPDEFRDISNGMRQLSNVLREIDDLSTDQELTNSQEKLLNRVSQECFRTLSNLEEYLNKYHVLDQHIGKSDRSKRIWKQVTWDQSEIRYFRECINSSLNTYNLFLKGLNNNMTANIQQTTNRIDQRQADQEQHEILNWITPIDHTAQQSDIAKRRQKGTGKWFLDSREFQHWVKGKSATLFSSGIPGAGKTMMTSSVIEYVENQFNPTSALSKPVGIAYIFCTFQRREQQQLDDLLAGLLKQLVRRLPLIPEGLESLLKERKKAGKRLAVDDLIKYLNTAVVEFSKLFIIIDALDECQISCQTASDLLSNVFDLQSKHDVNVFATSRHIPEIICNFNDCPKLDIHASEDDIRIYLAGHMSELPSFVSKDLQLQIEILTRISNSIDGMFLLAKLHHDSLKGKMTKKAIRSALKKLPTGTAAYSHAYQEAMMRISAQHLGEKEMAMNILAWVCCAKRPLSSIELQHGLAVEIGEPDIDEDNIPELDSMLSICAGLVIFNQKTDTIQLVHYTTQEYFDQTWDSWFPEAHILITTATVTYLSFTAFSTGICKDHETFKTKLVRYPLYDYSVQNWGHHAREIEQLEDCPTALEQAYMKFLTNDNNLSTALQGLVYSKITGGENITHNQVTPTSFTGVHMAAYFGLEKTTKMLLRKGLVADSRDTYGRTPLHLAAENGHESVIKLLIQSGADMNAKDLDGEIAFTKAIKNGDAAIVQLLVGALLDIDMPDEEGRTQLSWAAGAGNEMIVRILLERGADVNSQESSGETPLIRATQNGHCAIVASLLNAGSDINKKNNIGNAAIHHAVRVPVDVIKLLLKEGADIESTNCSGCTPISSAAGLHDTTATVDLLLKAGADLHARDCWGRTPLWKAANYRNGANASLLLEHGAEVDSKDKEGRTPLANVIKNEDIAMAALLLKYGAHPSAKDINDTEAIEVGGSDRYQEVFRLLLKNHAFLDFPRATRLGKSRARERAQNILHLIIESSKVSDFKDYEANNLMLCAANHGITQAIEFLLPKCSSLEVTDQSENTPLLLASKWGHELAAKLLLQNAADIEARNSEGQTPLSRAVSASSGPLIKALLDAGAHVDTKDREGRTPLSYAQSGSNACFAKMLLDAGADVNTKDFQGRTPLSHAASTSNIALVTALLDGGSRIEARDNKGRTPASYAAESGGTSTVELLLRQGATPDTKDVCGRTPLSWASGNGGGFSCTTSYIFKKWGHTTDRKKEVAQLFLKAGADPDSQDNVGQTPLFYACRTTHAGGVVNILLEKDADPNPKEESCQNALSFLVKNWIIPDTLPTDSLSRAITISQWKAVTCLLDRGADLENRDCQGRTPLMTSALRGAKKMVMLLLERGADPNARDNKEQTASMLATAEGHEEVAKILLETVGENTTNG